MATYSQTVTGAVTPSGALHISTSVALAGAVAPAAALRAAFAPSIAGTVAPAGALAASISRALAGAVAAFGGLSSRSISRALAGAVAAFGGLAAGVGQAPCNFTFGELKTLLGHMLDDDLVYYSTTRVGYALNRAERLFVFLTLCYEKTVSFALTNGQYFHNISEQISDFIAPLRVSHSGTRLRSDTLHNFGLRDATWRARAGNPVRYAQLGFATLFITPHPTAGSHTLDFTYAAMPPVMSAASAVPTIPGDQQAALLDLAYYFCRLPEGGAELQAAIVYFKRGIEQANKYASFVRAKSRGQLYDVRPFDLASYDMGRFDIKLAHERALMKRKQDEAK